MTTQPVVVLFGAGASFGAGATKPKPPPLGQGLFDVLQRLYPLPWGKIPTSLASSFRSNFEDGMGSVIENHGFSVASLMQDMAKFFSIFSVSDDKNLYVRLVRHALDHGYIENLLFSTLNYDCILETALSRTGLSTDYFGELPNNSARANLWKLHGSCNFKLKGLSATRGISFPGVGVTFGGGIDPIQPNEVQSYYSGNTALYPAMALFARGKPISIAPAPIIETQAKWDKIVRGASMVAVVGVNPNPADEHLWVPLAETNAELLFIGEESGFEAWRAQYRKNKISRFLGPRWDRSFKKFVSNLSEVKPI